MSRVVFPKVIPAPPHPQHHLLHPDPCSYSHCCTPLHAPTHPCCKTALSLGPASDQTASGQDPCLHTGEKCLVYNQISNMMANLFIK